MRKVLKKGCFFNFEILEIYEHLNREEYTQRKHSPKPIKTQNIENQTIIKPSITMLTSMLTRVNRENIELIRKIIC